MVQLAITKKLHFDCIFLACWMGVATVFRSLSSILSRIELGNSIGIIDIQRLTSYI